MATWSGWQNEFLLAARIIETPPNRNFLTDWAAHASSPQCARNPIDLWRKVGNSTDCDHPAGFPHWTQAYKTHANAATAFAYEVNLPQYAAILDTLGTGNPYQDTGYKNVHAALLQWPSVNFAAWYLAKMSGTGSGSGSGTGQGAHAHKGWQDLRVVVNHRMPAALRQSEKHTAAALRAISRGRKVRL